VVASAPTTGSVEEAAATDAARHRGAAPGKLLDDRDGRDQAVDAATAVLLGQVVAGQPDLGRLADDRPRELLGLVVLVRQRPHLALGEVVRHRLQVALDVV
jgi:hypothetical protein